MAKKRLRVAMIRCGGIAETHLKGYQLLDKVEVAVACDALEENAKKRSEEFDIPAVETDYKKVFADETIDASLFAVFKFHAFEANDPRVASTMDQVAKSNFQFYPGIDTMDYDTKPPLEPDADGFYPVPVAGMWKEKK